MHNQPQVDTFLTENVHMHVGDYLKRVLQK